MGSGNRLQTLPKELYALNKTLEGLVLSRNNLTFWSFPKEFQELYRLQILDLRNNSISKLPPWFDELDELHELTVYGNPVCSNGWVQSSMCPPKTRTLLEMEELGCSKQCSDMCLNVLLK